MTSTATLPQIKESFMLEAYGLEIRLWRAGEMEWGGMLRAGVDVIFVEFEADSVTSAKRYLDSEARSLASYRWVGDAAWIFGAPLNDDWRPWGMVN